ncbi:MAG: recombinase family protein [Anaerolineales bacterium]|jgi:site-specific DNA recombinase
MIKKRAVIYVRVSTEKQSEKSSPEDQEKACQELAERKEYEVIKMYSDIGTGESLSLRPGYQQLLKDAEAGKFEVLLAWKQDRLFRGYMYTGFIETMALVENSKVEIDLAAETFDETMAGIKAVMAKEENRVRVERTNQGVKARLRDGKIWGIGKKYGYSRTDAGEAAINKIEAKWVKQIYTWYLEDIPVRKISRKLVKAGAPQKRKGKLKTHWPTPIIYRILKDETYSSGIHKVKRAGEVFDIPVPQFIDPADYQMVQAKMKKNRTYPARRTKHKYLLAGLVTCPCGLKWGAYSRTRQQRYGYKPGTYPVTFGYYRCSRTTNTGRKEDRHPKCPGTKGVKRLEDYVWKKVSEVIRSPEILLEAAKEERERLKAEHKDAWKRKRKLKNELDVIQVKRDAYIDRYGESVANDGAFTKDDLERVLSRLEDEELTRKRELAEVILLTDVQFSDIDRLVNMRLEEAREVFDWWDKEPETEKEKELQFQDKKALIQALVKNVYLEKGKDPEITFVIDPAKISAKESQTA